MPGAESEPDRSHLDDTVADEEVAPSPPHSPTPLPSRAEPEGRSRAQRDLLGETVADAQPQRGRYGEVDLTRIFDRLTHVEENPLGRYDPEAGRTNVAVKFTVATEAVANAVRGVVSGALFTPFGKLLLAITAALAATALVIAASIFQERWMIVLAALFAPIALVLVYWRYQAWLGHKRYIYRLLETLGEDVSTYDPSKVNRRARAKAAGKPRRR